MLKRLKRLPERCKFWIIVAQVLPVFCLVMLAIVCIANNSDLTAVQSWFWGIVTALGGPAVWYWVNAQLFVPEPVNIPTRQMRTVL